MYGRPSSRVIWQAAAVTSVIDRIKAARQAWLRELPPVPVKARHAEWSAMSSTDDLYTLPNDAIVDLLLRAASRARTIRLDNIAARCSTELEAAWVNAWPGEHYRLLAALAEVTQARVIVEVGTFQGPGCLSLLAGAAPAATVVTYDVVPWPDVEGSVLRGSDFAGRLQQRIGDLASEDYLETQMDTLQAADLLFVDGPKDGVFEPAFCAKVLTRLTDRPRLVVFDDIGRLNMVQLWRDLPYPKLEATSLGHWSGTGLLLTAAD